MYFRHARKQTTRAYELTYTGGSVTGSALTAITETLTPDNAFDAYGNLEDGVVKVYPDEAALTSQSPAFTTTTANTFNNDTTHWLLGQLTCQVATATPAGGTALTSTVGFTYASTTGLVLTEVIEPDGQVTNCETASSDENITLVTSYEYDDFGNRTKITVDDLAGAAGGSLPARVTEIAYGEINASNTVVAANGRFAVSVENGEGHTEYRQYDGRFGAITRLEGPNGLETFFGYDSFGRQQSEIRADGTRSEVYRAFCPTSSACESAGGVIQVLSLETGAPASVVIADQYGRTLKAAQIGFDGVPLISDTEYDNKGQVEKVHKPYVYGQAPNPEVVTTFEYDVVGRLIKEQAPGDTTGTATAYFGPGTNSSVSPSIAYRSGVSVTNDKGQVTTQYFDATGALIAALDAAGTATRYTYDAHGNLKTVTVNNDSTTTITNTYDVLGRKRTMVDPDLGEWDYFYNSFGQVRRQEDANGNDTELEYDEIGRLTKRTENENDETVFTYDTASHGIGQLAQVTGPESDTKTFEYDTLGRPTTTTTALPGVSGSFVTAQSYDPEGRVDLVTYPASTEYPSGLQVRYTFNAHGYLETAINEADDGLYWRLDEQTPTETTFTLGNQVVTSHVYDAITGDLEAIRASSYGQTHDVQNLEYAFDTLGNLTRRMDHNRDREESINAATGYDALNRVKSVERKVLSTQSLLSTLSVTYDALGNIATKSDVGSYGYGSPSGCNPSHAGPHAVTSVGNANFCYDANGNEVSGYDFTTGSARATTWTAFNKPAQITDGTDTIDFDYGADRARFRQDNSYTGIETLYIDGLFEREIDGSAHTDIHYIYAAGEAVAIFKSASDDSDETLYLHRDHLGSVVEVTDDTGTVVESFSYDAFGRRREASDWSAATGEITGANTPRGYTGHEHLEGVSAVVHMNGRVYDAALGRMLSADPYVQFPAYSQSFNRYSYVLNNPLRYTDPSGFTTVFRVSRQPIFGYTYKISGVGGKVVGRCAASNPLCGGMSYQQLPAPDLPEDMPYEPPVRWGWVTFGYNYDDLDISWGIIGWNSVVTISVSYQGASWTTFSDSIANNASTGAGTHAIIAENVQVAQPSPAISQPGNANTGLTASRVAAAVVNEAYNFIIGDTIQGVKDTYENLKAGAYGAAALSAAMVACDVIKGCKVADKILGWGRRILGKVWDRADDVIEKVAETCGCFVAGTLVATAHGLVPIENIEVGDQVWAQDENTGETALKRVTAVIRPPERVIWTVTFEIDQGTVPLMEVFDVTDDHPWASIDGAWVRTDELKPGDEIRRADGASARVMSVLETERTEQTYNLSVADFHTFFVGEARVWVHNTDSTCVPNKTDRLKEHLTTSDLEAARREAAGEVVSRKADGTPFDHIQEVRDAQTGLLNRIQRINNRLGNPNISTTERAELQRELGEASRLLDRSEGYLPR